MCYIVVGGAVHMYFEFKIIPVFQSSAISFQNHRFNVAATGGQELGEQEHLPGEGGPTAPSR